MGTRPTVLLYCAVHWSCFKVKSWVVIAYWMILSAPWIPSPLPRILIDKKLYFCLNLLITTQPYQYKQLNQNHTHTFWISVQCRRYFHFIFLLWVNQLFYVTPHLLQLQVMSVCRIVFGWSRVEWNSQHRVVGVCQADCQRQWYCEIMWHVTTNNLRLI